MKNTGARLQCIETACEARFAIDQVLYTCPRCGGLLDVAYDFAGVGSARELISVFTERRGSMSPLDSSGVWRFRDLLPFAGDCSRVVTLSEGNTPLFDAPRSGEWAGLGRLRLKHQGMNPTGSFKDNGMTTGITQAVLIGATMVACASTGNTSASMAAYAARAGLASVVFVPAGQVAYGKLSQALEYGALVVEIEGSFDDAMRLVREAAGDEGVYLLNSINPFRLEGQKTIIIEMLEQLGWRTPDWIVVPGGNLGNSAAFGKALRELFELGFIDRLPRLAVVQAEGAAPLYEMVISGAPVLSPVEDPATLATAIRIGAPVSWRKALRALEWTDGVVERVSEQEIADAKAVIGRDGIGCEPASAVTLAGTRRLVRSGVIPGDADVVGVLTGNLLKDTDYTVAYHRGELKLGHTRLESSYGNRPIRIRATREAVLDLIRKAD